MTREEHTTERALRAAEAEWLTARGWTLNSNGRWHHRSLTLFTDTNQHDAMQLSRAEPLRYRKQG